MEGEVKKCPYCGTKNVVKNGHLKSNGKQRWICRSPSCRKTFSETSIENYPKTHIPFPITCLCLYFYDEGKSVKGYILPFVNVYHEKKVSLPTFYSWKKKYGDNYSKRISKSHAMRYHTFGHIFEIKTNKIDENLSPPYDAKIEYEWGIIDTTPVEGRKGKNKQISYVRTKFLLECLYDYFGLSVAREIVCHNNWKEFFVINMDTHTMVAKIPKIICVKTEQT
jgi:transposase-like protein